MIVGIHGSCAASCNQEQVQVAMVQVVSQYSRFFDVAGNYGYPDTPVVTSHARSFVSTVQLMYGTYNKYNKIA